MVRYASNDEVARRRQEFYTALESGRYAQTTGQLRGKEGYCCLGVAEDVSGLRRWIRNEDPENEHYMSYPKGVTPEDIYDEETGETLFYGETEALSPEVQQYYEFGSRDPLLGVHPSGNRYYATQYNDVLGASFTQIASAFRERYPACTDPGVTGAES